MCTGFLAVALCVLLTCEFAAFFCRDDGNVGAHVHVANFSLLETKVSEGNNHTSNCVPAYTDLSDFAQITNG